MCKSFFNPPWTDTGFLSIYGRAGGVNWVWAFSFTFDHAVVSITVPIFLTEALFPLRAAQPWLRRRGARITVGSLLAVVLLGFLVFDNRQFWTPPPIASGDAVFGPLACSPLGSSLPFFWACL